MIARRSLSMAALATAMTAPMAMAQPADKQELLADLMKLETESWQYLKDKNATGAADYLADDAILVFGGGMRFTKPEFLKAFPDLRLDSFSIAPGAEVRAWTADVATLIYHVTYTIAVKGAKPQTQKLLSCSTYARRSGKWLSVLYQETPLP